MSDQYYFYAAGFIVALLISIILAFYTYKKRSNDVHIYFILMIFSIFIWTLGAFLEFILVGFPNKIFWSKICYLGIATIAPFLFMFTLSYGNYYKYLTRRNIVLLMIIPIIVIILAFTNEWHGLIWPQIYYISTNMGMMLTYKHSFGVWINLIYSYTLLITSISLFTYILINSPKIYKLQVSVILFAIIIPFIFNIIYALGVFPDPIDITPLAFVLTVILISISIFKYHLLDILPIAHSLLFENMENAYLVFDDQDRLLEMNSFAEEIFKINSHDVGKKIDDVLFNWAEIRNFYYDKKSKNKELLLKNGFNIWVNIQKSFIRDYKKTFCGKLIIVTDIDARKKSEIDLIESQRMLETLMGNLPGMAYRCKNDPEWTMEFVSEGCLELTGSHPSDLINNKKLSYASLIHPSDQKRVWKKIQSAINNSMPFEIVYRIITTNGQMKYVWERGTKVSSNNNIIFLEGFITDITNTKTTEDKLRRSIKEKEVLLQEIHHRVKNNMQIISSLLNLQSRYSQSKSSDEIFKESQDRVKAMALVHEKLYRSQNLEKIDFSEYITSLVTNLITSYENRLLNFELELSNLYLDINTAIPCGLIINELVTNSIKHAFGENQEGNIHIKFFSAEDHLKLIINDDGVGLPAEFDLENANTLGLQLVHSLIQQLDGYVKINTDNGTEFEITFKELKYEERI